MKSAAGEKQCAHRGCTCPATDGEYCSLSCEAAPDAVVCICGHSECKARS